MGATADAIRAHYAPGDLARRVLDALAATGVDVEHLDIDDLAPIDEFHADGRAVTRRLAEEAGVRSDWRVLDVGAGLGGPARYLASTYGCRVTALELVGDLCRAAELLTRRTGLDHLVDVRQGNATDLRFEAGSFDLVWLQHVSMNVDDKHAFLTGLRRVLRDGGRLAMCEVLGGDGRPLHLPVPWAGAPDQSFLESPDVFRRLLVATGFVPVVWEDLTDDLVARAPERADDLARPGLAVYLDDAPARLANYRRNLADGRISVVLAVCDTS